MKESLIAFGILFLAIFLWNIIPLLVVKRTPQPKPASTPDITTKPGMYPETSFEWLNKWGPRIAFAVIALFLAAPFILALLPFSVTFLIAIYLITRK